MVPKTERNLDRWREPATMLSGTMRDFEFEDSWARSDGRPVFAYGQPTVRKSLDRHIVAILNQHPDGLTFYLLSRQVLKTYGKQVLTRTIYVRLLTLVRGHHVLKSGRGKNAVYSTAWPERF